MNKETKAELKLVLDVVIAEFSNFRISDEGERLWLIDRVIEALDEDFVIDRRKS